VRLVRTLGACALACAALAAGAGSAGAKTASQPVVVINHVDNPRGLAFAPNGTLYAAAAGRAGTQCLAPDECVGLTSAVWKRSNGKNSRLVSNLPSAGGKDGSFTVGVDGVSVAPDGSVFAIETSAGQDGLPPGFPPRWDTLGHLLRIWPNGRITKVAAIDQYEWDHNPDGAQLDSDPYAVLALSSHRQLVADAAGNDILEVIDGKISTFAVLPKNQWGGEAVPTSLAKGPDGAIYVGELGGEGTKAGGSRVWRIQPGHKPTVFRTGFTAITGIAFGRSGALFVTQLTQDPVNFTPDGDVVRVSPSGARTHLGSGQLQFPAGLAIGPSGGVYVSNWSILPGHTSAGGPFGGANGQVVRLP